MQKKKSLIRHTINWKCVLWSSSILMYLKHCCPEPCQNLMFLVLLREDNWTPPEANLNTKTQVHMADLRIALRKHHIEKHKSETRQRRQPILGAISSQLSLQATGIHFLALPAYHIREQCRPQRPEKARKCMFQQAEAKLECNEVARMREYRKDSYSFLTSQPRASWACGRHFQGSNISLTNHPNKQRVFIFQSVWVETNRMIILKW